MLIGFHYPAYPESAKDKTLSSSLLRPCWDKLSQQLKLLFAVIAVPLRIFAGDATAADIHAALVDVLDEVVVENGLAPDDACDVLASESGLLGNAPRSLFCARNA